MKIGTDIIEIERIAKAMERAHFGSRVFTAHELAYAKSRGKQESASLAGMYAAKEAFFKALGTGFRGGTWAEVEIHRDALGAPYIVCTGFFYELLKEKNLTTIELSISHCRSYATAVVLLS
ncbi:holo-ACP synthase [uncultured Veillonella sp.]|uniref:holo-ACP synthase n=1 Tax=uncultured Veillonella sp. TaxID=159268 RepID=UPI002634BE35|nr:holo-ACP synthase [uncultured Veillonella sp.]